MGLYHGGRIQFLEAWGNPDLEAVEPLSTDALFAFPAFTEVLVAAAARALSAARVLDVRTPLARYIPELPQGLGRVTLDQLLSHTAGLDDREADGTPRKSSIHKPSRKWRPFNTSGSGGGLPKGDSPSSRSKRSVARNWMTSRTVVKTTA